ncbi:CopG family ribbon-helix-helix protein [Nitrosospira sp. Nsp1]|uniref:CopG family ribbon-helix-helix protein n=1 Tax=Nitrosospira sp. Nsp1 TaxID=136547 RepID=UPI00088F48A7|nr:CopG family ribbon-helix-helix protein [Nitrosospira sp. Nsp1]SCX39883.1 Predicted transcriptional regulator [Nitrosospira sp. Nsp1]
MATSIKIDEKLKNRVRDLANARRRSANWIMKEAIQQYVDREEAIESIQQEATESWIEFQETGLHITGQEASAWLRTWGTDEETEIPECHK